MKTNPFEGIAFTPTKFSTADDKMKFARQFVKLVTNGFRQSDFPKWFYQRLSNCRGHIAHYNQGGFWDEWFSSKARQYEFLIRWRQEPVYGGPEWTFSDVERAIQNWLIANEAIMRKVEGEARGQIDNGNLDVAIAAYNALPDALKDKFEAAVKG